MLEQFTNVLMIVNWTFLDKIESRSPWKRLVRETQCRGLRMSSQNWECLLSYTIGGNPLSSLGKFLMPFGDSSRIQASGLQVDFTRSLCFCCFYVGWSKFISFELVNNCILIENSVSNTQSKLIWLWPKVALKSHPAKTKAEIQSSASKKTNFCVWQNAVES